MSILSPNYTELMQDRSAEKEAIAKARPTGKSKSKFRDIEEKMFIREMKSLKRANVTIG